VQCVKLNQELPAIDDSTPEGQRALKMAMLFGGPELQQKIRENVSLEAWKAWTNHMLMVINEFRLDPGSPESNKVLGEQMERFFFGEPDQVPGYVPPKE
jgi:Fe-S cluster biosynthesis and repair protein YggX